MPLPAMLFLPGHGQHRFLRRILTRLRSFLRPPRPDRMRVPDMTTGPTTAETEAVFGILRARLPTELALLILDRAGFWVRVSAARRNRLESRDSRAAYLDQPSGAYRGRGSGRAGWR